MRKKMALPALMSLSLGLTAMATPLGAQPDRPRTRPAADIVKAAPAGDWTAIDPADVLVMTLAPDAQGKARQVFIQLLPAPFSRGWIGNMRKLAAAHWWDGGAIYRVQDNWVAQFGDPDEDTPQAKPLPAGLAKVPESDYLLRAFAAPEFINPGRDAYAPRTGIDMGFPVGFDDSHIWPTHCYGTVGVGRNNSPDTGTGAELYAVIGTPPRQLDRNIAVVGRVIEGIEHLSSLPRAPGNGMYHDRAKNTPILSIRLSDELPAADRPRFEYLAAASQSFRDYVEARVHRRDDFIIYSPGSADICNIPIPVRRRG